MTVLLDFFQQYPAQISKYLDYEAQLEKLIKLENCNDQASLLCLYDQTYPIVENFLWEADNFDKVLEIYQSLFREQELILSQSAIDNRYDFILSITIADRPKHLNTCLESIFQLCKQYAYGGKNNGFYSKITVVIVEDSKEQIHIQEDIKLAEQYCKKGLKVHHYGQLEQYQLMLEIPTELRQQVSSIIGDPARENFYLKGQAITRNLSYLKALQLSKQKQSQPMLYFFVDSDQLFQVNLPAQDGDRAVCALNYFYYINRIFNENNIAMLTGKLVGDPPVSPSVMAVNFMDDVIAFLQQLSDYKSLQECQFHPQSRVKPSDAAYHDMAQLFGFEGHKQSYDYCCPLNSEHDHIACLKSFADRINYFFFGEHLTRKTYFSYSAPLTDIQPARTIYPGNYITTLDGLKYIIAFGKLRLRMSGPTSGRLIQAEIQEKFACSNLPMLHTRTLQTHFKDEFRPGVEDNIENIDLSDEFERQFFGDLMLFSVASLSKEGLASEDFNQQILSKTFKIVEQELLDLYENKHQNVKLKCQQLSGLVNKQQHWWNKDKVAAPSVCQLQQFIKNIQFNFGEHSTAYQQILSPQHRQKRVDSMIEALLNYHRDRSAWDQMLQYFTAE
ncbi:MAG: hypothetical protein QM479_07830 [Pseudomonadota bacterium]